MFFKESIDLADSLAADVADSAKYFEIEAEHCHVFSFYEYCERQAHDRLKIAGDLKSLISGDDIVPTRPRILMDRFRGFILGIRALLARGQAQRLDMLIRRESELEHRVSAALSRQDIDPVLAEIGHRVEHLSSDCQRELKSFHNWHRRRH